MSQPIHNAFRVVALVAIAAAGCGKATKVEVGEGRAGTVVQLRGEVTASRDGAAARSLSEGAEVFRDDTIVTSEDAEVTIRLDHNKAALSLAASTSTRVDHSVAWKAPKEVGGSVLEPVPSDPTAVAGRDTNREAADNPTTAIGDKDALHQKKKDGESKDGAVGGTIGLGTTGSGSGGGGVGVGTKGNESPGGSGAGGSSGGSGDDRGSGKRDDRNDERDEVVAAAKQPASRFVVTSVTSKPKNEGAASALVSALKKGSFERCILASGPAFELEVIVTATADGHRVKLRGTGLKRAQTACARRALEAMVIKAPAGSTLRAVVRLRKPSKK